MIEHHHADIEQGLLSHPLHQVRQGELQHALKDQHTQNEQAVIEQVVGVARTDVIIDAELHKARTQGSEGRRHDRDNKAERDPPLVGQEEAKQTSQKTHRRLLLRVLSIRLLRGGSC